MITRGPHRANLIDVTDEEKELFRALYMDGSWPVEQAARAFSVKRLNELIPALYLMPVQTDLGRLTVLLARGRVAAFGTCDRAEAFSAQFDQLYRRLALQQLGWTLMQDQALCQHDRSGQMVAAHTPYGPSLVYATLGSGQGVSLQTMSRLVRQHRSSALYHGYELVILTPSRRRGQQLAAGHPSWLHVVHCRPKVGGEQRLCVYREVAEPAPNRPNRPDHDARVHAARRALAVDSVLSRRQLERHYGLQPTDLPGVPYVEAVVRPVHSRYGLEVPTRLYLADRKLARLHDHVLTHRAGVAEMRRQLQVPPDPDQWEVEARGRLDYEEPDAVWHTASGDVAIEYDVGSYTMKVVDRKVGTFKDRGFDGVVWGAASPQRAARLGGILQPQGVQVMTTQWWLERASEGALRNGPSA